MNRLDALMAVSYIVEATFTSLWTSLLRTFCGRLLSLYTIDIYHRVIRGVPFPVCVESDPWRVYNVCNNFSQKMLHILIFYWFLFIDESIILYTTWVITPIWVSSALNCLSTVPWQDPFVDNNRLLWTGHWYTHCTAVDRSLVYSERILFLFIRVTVSDTRSFNSLDAWNVHLPDRKHIV